MNTIFKNFIVLVYFLSFISCKSPGIADSNNFLIKTSLGDIKIKLYDNTPIHRDNFIKLVKMGFYDGISFHRVIKDFMIQAGDPSTKSGFSKEQSDTLSNYKLPSEFRPENIHKKGALAAAREGNNINPSMKSSGTQFYIVQGIKLSDSEITAAESTINKNIRQSMFNKFLYEVADSVRKNGMQLSEAEIQEKASSKMFNFLNSVDEFKYTEEQKAIYKTSGGVPRLDGTYTVFGEVTEGFDVIDKIASVPTNNSDRPINDVKIIKVKILSK